MARNDSLGDRMKRYEDVPKNKLTRRTPVIIRLDGKAFHTWTKRCERPFDERLHKVMTKTTEFLCMHVQSAVLGYTQSDEISLVLKDWTRLNSEPWFDNEVQKIASVSASYATAIFNRLVSETFPKGTALAFFDARVFNVPKEEVTNYFVWRQQDATRNSVQMLAQSLFSHKQLQGKNNSQVQDMMMLEKGVNWNDLDPWKKRGACVIKGGVYPTVDKGCETIVPGDGWRIDDRPPIFTKDREYIERLLHAYE